MSEYKDRLRKASFRGVNFFLESADFAGGKRVKMHEFSGRSIPFTEDMRRKGRIYSIQGYLIGDNVFALRDELTRAIERDGYGTLIHPFYGTLKVEAGDLKFNESMGEARIARFTCDFYEKGQASNPSSVTDKIGKFFSKMSEKLTNIKVNFGNLFSVTNAPQYILSAATDLVQTANDVFLETFGQLADPSEYVANVKKSVLDFQDNVEILLSNTTEFADDLVNVLSSIGSITNSHKTKQEIYNHILDFDSTIPAIPETTSTRSIQKTNQDALISLIKVSVYLIAMRDFVAAINDTFPDDDTTLKNAVNDIYYSFDEIKQRQNELMDGLDAFMTLEINNDIYDDLNEISALMFEALPSPDDAESKIKRIVSYNAPETTNSVMLSYELYESIDNEQDIIDRNKIENPCFVLGGEDLEVLSS